MQASGNGGVLREVILCHRKSEGSCVCRETSGLPPRAAAEGWLPGQQEGASFGKTAGTQKNPTLSCLYEN